VEIENLYSIQYLEVVDLSNNKIEAIDDNIVRLINLAHLNLENNEISRISTVLGFMDLKSILLGGNCLKSMLSVINKGATQILEFLKNRH